MQVQAGGFLTEGGVMACLGAAEVQRPFEASLLPHLSRRDLASLTCTCRALRAWLQEQPDLWLSGQPLLNLCPDSLTCCVSSCFHPPACACKGSHPCTYAKSLHASEPQSTSVML